MSSGYSKYQYVQLMGSSPSSPVSPRLSSPTRSQSAALQRNPDSNPDSPKDTSQTSSQSRNSKEISSLSISSHHPPPNPTPIPSLNSHSIPSPTPARRSLSSMARIKEAVSKDNKATRSNPNRPQRRKAIVESPEFESYSCHCRLGHKDFDACASDPQSPYFSPGSGIPASNFADTTERKQRATGRATKKRKAGYGVEEVKYECGCGEGHENALECEYAGTLKRHIEISTSIVVGSQTMVTIIVGADTKQSFLVHKELLALYSRYFHNIFAGHVKQEIKQEIETEQKLAPEVLKEVALIPELRSPSREAAQDLITADRENLANNNSVKSAVTEPETYELANITPSQYAQFLSFLYAGRIIDAFEPLALTNEHDSPEALWYVGLVLSSPSFQNNILEGLRTSSNVKRGTWPSPEDIEIIYDAHSKHEQEYFCKGAGENGLKKLAAHCIASNPPGERYESESAAGLEWKNLFSKRSDISTDVLMSVSTRWADVKPWDDKLRGDYMVEEQDVEERWEKLILDRKKGKGMYEGKNGNKSEDDVGGRLEQQFLEAQEKKRGYPRFDSDEISLNG